MTNPRQQRHCPDYSEITWKGRHFCDNKAPIIGACSFCDDLVKSKQCPRGVVR